MKYFIMIFVVATVVGCSSPCKQTLKASPPPAFRLQLLSDSAITADDFIHLERHKDIYLEWNTDISVAEQNTKYDDDTQTQSIVSIRVEGKLDRTSVLAALSGFDLKPINTFQFEMKKKSRIKISKGSWELEANHVCFNDSGEGIAHGNVTMRHKDGRIAAADSVTVDLIDDGKVCISLIGDMIHIAADSGNKISGANMRFIGPMKEWNANQSVHGTR